MWYGQERPNNYYVHADCRLPYLWASTIYHSKYFVTSGQLANTGTLVGALMHILFLHISPKIRFSH